MRLSLLPHLFEFPWLGVEGGREEAHLSAEAKEKGLDFYPERKRNCTRQETQTRDEHTTYPGPACLGCETLAGESCASMSEGDGTLRQLEGGGALVSV